MLSLMRRLLNHRTVDPRAPERTMPTADQLRAMLDPNWDPTKQWDGTCAMVSSTRIEIRSPRVKS